MDTYRFVLLVSGGRDFRDADLLTQHLDNLVADQDKKQILIVSGGCRGADLLAVKYAKARGINYIIVQAQWRNHGSAAGPRRNQRMIDQYRPHAAICFPSPASVGTWDCYRRLETYRDAAGSRLRELVIVKC